MERSDIRPVQKYSQVKCNYNGKNEAETPGHTIKIEMGNTLNTMHQEVKTPGKIILNTTETIKSTRKIYT